MKPAIPLLHDYLEASARRLPGKIALVCGGQRLTYRELDERANALAHTLRERGVKRGDRVVVHAENTPEACIAFWGVLKANAVVSMVNAQVKPEKLAWLINDCRAAALITPRAQARAPVVITQLTGASRDPPPRECIDVDLASIIYTSGSTGDPKGVMLTHRNMLTAATSITTYLEKVEDDVILGVLPLSFDYGLYQMIMAFKLGARLVLERSFAYPAQVLTKLVEEGVTGFPGVPTIFAMLAELKDLSRYDFSKIRYVTNTAAALTEKHIVAVQRIFPQARVYSMYGLTECKRCTYLPPEDLARKPTSVGFAIPNTELWLVDEHDQRVGPGVVGQLVIRGATVMRGYWEKPEETARKLRPGPLPGEQVLYTGDLCRLDEEGYLYFVARMDEVIKSRGEKVAPKEVESAIMTLPGVKECAVVGVPDEILGQAVKAFVVPEEGASFTVRDVVSACARRLEAFMVPKYVAIIDSLPKTTSGKIRKTGLA